MQRRIGPNVSRKLWNITTISRRFKIISKRKIFTATINKIILYINTNNNIKFCLIDMNTNTNMINENINEKEL